MLRTNAIKQDSLLAPITAPTKNTHEDTTMHAIVNIALRAARIATEEINQAFARLDRVKVFEKGKNDFVTDIDRAVENCLMYHIRKAYPEHSFLCEESGLSEGEDKDTLWIIDPIDGTRNFIRGFPHFCISLACVQKGVIQHAVIVDPIKGDEFSASRGAGARLNDTRIRVGKQASLNSAAISLSSTSNHYDEFLALLAKLQDKCGGVRFTGSAALDLAYVASGRMDAGWLAGMKKWDVAAGILLVQEAGGLISDGAGNPDCLDSESLVFANPKCFKQLLKVLSL